MFGGNYRFVLALTVVSLLGAGCGQPQPVPVPVNPNTIGYGGYSVGSCGAAAGTPIDQSNPITYGQFNASQGSGSLTMNIGTTTAPNLSNGGPYNVVASGTLTDPDIATMLSQFPMAVPAQPSYCVTTNGLGSSWLSNGQVGLTMQGPMGGNTPNGQPALLQVQVYGTVISGRIQGTVYVTLWVGTQYAQNLPGYNIQ